MLAADRALARVAPTKNLFARLRVVLSWAHIHARRAEPSDLAQVDKVLSEATSAAQRAGFGLYLGEAHLLACELLAARRAPGARTCFQRVAREATAQGLGLIARRATAQVH